MQHRQISIGLALAKASRRASRRTPRQTQERSPRSAFSLPNHEWTRIDTQHKQLAVLSVHWCLFVVNEDFGHRWRWIYRLPFGRTIDRRWSQRCHPRRLQRLLRSEDQAWQHFHSREGGRRLGCRSRGGGKGRGFFKKRNSTPFSISPPAQEFDRRFNSRSFITTRMLQGLCTCSKGLVRAQWIDSSWPRVPRFTAPQRRFRFRKRN